MSKVLYITANPKPIGKSFCLTVGDAFLKEYKNSHPQDEVDELNLYLMDIQFVDNDVLKAWDELAQGCQFENLNECENTKLGKMESLVQQFMAADKYIFVSPLWNLGVPPMLKAYMDNVVLVNKTFKYTANGPIGLLQNKKAVHIQSCGGIYSQEPMASYECGARYLKTILGFLGVTDEQVLFIEGTNQFPEKAEEIKQLAIQRATEIAKSF